MPATTWEAAHVADLELSGRKVLVIGAGTDAGRVIATALAAVGADIAVASGTVNGDEVMAVRRTRRAVEALGSRAVEYAFDTSLGQNVLVSTRQVAKEMGGIDLLVNAQDYPVSNPLQRTSDAEWAHTLTLNLGGAFFACRAAVREMSGGGGILNVIPPPAQEMMPAAAYTAARYGLLGLTRALARELADRAIRINALTVAAEAAGRSVERRDMLGAGGWTVRPADLGVPDDLGAVAVYLAGSGSARLSGQCVVVGADTVPGV